MEPRPLRLFREVLLNRGFEFCDEGVPQHADDPPPAEGRALQALLAAGLEASSADHDSQDIACTLDDSPDNFWSSRGSPSTDAEESLLYCLRAPLCVVRYLQLVVFRAHFQFGEPLYPPAFISVQVGPSRHRLMPPTVKFSVRPTDGVQTFALPANLPPGRYLRLTLHGKRQRQLEDLQYYQAIQRVEAFGEALSPSDVVRYRDWARTLIPAPAVQGSIPAHAVQQQLGWHHAASAAAAEEQEREQQQQQGDGGDEEAGGAGHSQQQGGGSSSTWERVLQSLQRQPSGYASEGGSFVG